jgi:hypothetical protein
MVGSSRKHRLLLSCLPSVAPGKEVTRLRTSLVTLFLCGFGNVMYFSWKLVLRCSREEWGRWMGPLSLHLWSQRPAYKL